MRPRLRVLCLLLAPHAMTGCARPPPAPPPPRAVIAVPLAPPRPPPPAWTYYTPIDVAVHANVHGPDLPLADVQITFADGAPARWAALPNALKEAVRKQGFAVLASDAKRSRLGDYYADLRAARVPYVVTLDALVLLAHVAIDRALAEVEERTLAPSLDACLKRLDGRLAAERRGAGGDATAAYDVARGIVAVAEQLSSPGYAPPEDLAPLVAEEAKRALAHAGPSQSPLLGVTLDYSAFAPRGAADKSDARAAVFRAMTWLGTAPLMLVARGEAPGATVQTSKARVHARAALLLGRLLDPEVDAEASRAWNRITRVSELVGGTSDDPSPRDLAKVGVTLGIDARDVQAIANVAKVDRLRHALAERTPPRLYDGAAAITVDAPRADGGAPDGAFLRAATSARLLPARAALDAEVMQGLVFPSVGKIVSESDPQPATARDAIRALPSALDVAAWLGSSEARTLLHEAGDDAYAGYDDAMKRLYARRPPEEMRHASIALSALDAFATVLAPSAADAAQPFSTTSQWRRRKLEVVLGGWTALRHDMTPFARFPLGPLVEAPAPPPRGESVTAFVEPQPEAIAKLLAMVRQATRGLWAVGELPEDAPSRALLRQVDDLLASSLAVALREANDEALAPEERAALDELPSRLVALDLGLAASHANDTTLAVDVHLDTAGGRVLEEAIGDLDDLYLVLREPRSGRMVLAVGAALTHYEFSQPSSARLSDDGWRARLHASSPPDRDAFTSGYVIAPAR